MYYMHVHVTCLSSTCNVHVPRRKITLLCVSTEHVQVAPSNLLGWHDKNRNKVWLQLTELNPAGFLHTHIAMMSLIKESALSLRRTAHCHFDHSDTTTLLCLIILFYLPLKRLILTHHVFDVFSLHLEEGWTVDLGWSTNYIQMWWYILFGVTVCSTDAHITVIFLRRAANKPVSHNS